MSKDSKEAKPVSGPRNILISEGLLIAASPVIAYAGAFAYKAGFCRAFRIPVSLITVDLTTVLIAFGGVVAVGLVLFMLADLAVMMKIDVRSPIGGSLVRLSVPIFLLVALFLISGTVGRWWLGAVGALVLLALLEFGLPLLTQPDKKTYAEKLLAQQAREARIDSLVRRL